MEQPASVYPESKKDRVPWGKLAVGQRVALMWEATTPTIIGKVVEVDVGKKWVCVATTATGATIGGTPWSLGIV